MITPRKWRSYTVSQIAIFEVRFFSSIYVPDDLSGLWKFHPVRYPGGPELGGVRRLGRGEGFYSGESPRTVRGKIESRGHGGYV